MQIDLTNAQNHLDWVKRAFYLNTTVPNAQKRVPKRGCVYECDLGVGVGSEMQKKRPCIVISNNDNSNLPCMVPLQEYTDSNGIVLDGSANTSCIVCVSKARLGNLIIQLDKKDLEAVEESLEASLGMSHRTVALKQEIERLRNYIGKLLNKSGESSSENNQEQ